MRSLDLGLNELSTNEKFVRGGGGGGGCKPIIVFSFDQAEQLIDFKFFNPHNRKPIFNRLKAKVYKWINRKAFYKLHFIYESRPSLVSAQGFFTNILC